MIRGQKGQSLVEFILMMVMVVSMTIKIGIMGINQWRQSQCAYLVFEAVLARLTGRISAEIPSGVYLGETSEKVTGTAFCGKAKTVVQLPKLEGAKW